jgi:ATP-dependent Clp protease ATP-binding subunit ClpC
MATQPRKRGTLDPKLPSRELAQALNRASDSLKQLGRPVLSPEMLLLEFVRNDACNAHRILQQLIAARGYQWPRFEEEVGRLARERLAPDVDFDWLGEDGRRTPLADDLLIALDEALTLARARDEVYVGSEHVLAGMTDRRVGVARVLERHGITPRAVEDAIAANGTARSSTTTDHVALARQGEITPVYFRNELLRDLIGLLTLAGDRHVILVGAPGVGKRTLVYSLALLIAEGKGPANIKSVVEINERALLDDPRLAVQAAVRRADGGILFVPGIARFFGGFKAEFPETAGKELQKAFFGNDVVVIGTASEAEYAERLQPTAAISGHAHALRVEATSVEETTAILDVIRPRFEADYGLTVAADSLKEVARLAGRYLTTQPLPASAVHLLHRTCALVKMGQQSSLVEPRGASGDQTVDAEDVMVTISQLTGIPVSRLGADERARYANMVEHLRQRIIGQDEAVLAVSRAVKTARVGLKDPRRPIGSFFFLGPTGVGKTELAKALAEFMFGNEDAMIVLDMTEYQDENAVSRMIGAPPGYVGYEEGGQLTEKVATMPYAVVLFDEVEKAHPRVLDVLLQIMDEGRLTDGKGRTVSFREAVIILTSNIGSQYLVDATLPASAAREMAEADLKRALRPEFLNRLTDIIFFNRLDEAALRNVLGLLLKKESAMVAERGITLEVSEDARTWLLAQNDHPEWGARPLRRIIEKYVREPLADWMLREDPPPGSAVQVVQEGDGLAFHKQTGRTPRAS